MERKMVALDTNYKTYIEQTNIVSPLGFTTTDNFEQVIQGKSGLSYKKFDFIDKVFPVGIVKDESIEQAFRPYLTGQNQNYSKLEKMSILSVAKVLEKCSFSAEDKDVLFIFCSTKGNIDALETKANDKQLCLFKTAKRIANHFGFTHDPLVVSNACISGSLGIVLANRLLQKGLYRHIVIAAADSISNFTLSGFNAFNAIDEAPCKPYDANRKGINIGEAAASMILSRSKHTPSGSITLVDGAVSNDANHISAPSRTGEGLYQCIKKILARQEITIDFISGHGTATNYNDAMESWAFERAGIAHVPLHSLKGYYGHTLGASGLLESILAVRSLEKNQTIASKNFDKLGVPHKVQPITKSKQTPLKTCIKTSSGFGGCNIALLFKKND